MVSPFNRLYFVGEGMGILSVGENEVPITPDNVYLVPCNLLFSYKCNDYLKKFYVHVNVEYYGIDIFSNLKEIFSYRQKDVLNYILPTGDSLGDALKLKSAIYETIYKLVSINSDAIREYTDSLSAYLSIFKYISDNLDKNLKIEDICKRLGYSGTTLYKKFKEENKLSLKKYIEKQRAAKIQNYLLIGEKSIKEIANDMEFCDEYYMSKFFKKVTGMTPSQYRKHAGSIYSARNAGYSAGQNRSVQNR